VNRSFRRIGIAVVALVVFLLLRTHVAQRYLIPSRSMEPTFHGDKNRGDIVLVDKTGWCRPLSAARLQRFDIVVVRDRENPAGDPLVKRVVSLGDELLKISDGDIFVRSLAGEPWARVQKDPVVHADLRFTFFEHRAGGASDPQSARYLTPPPGEDGVIVLRGGAPTCESGAEAITAEPNPAQTQFLASRVVIDNSFLDAAGRRSFAGKRCGNDVGIELDLELDDSCGGLVLAILHHDQKVLLSYARGGRVTWHGRAHTETAAPLSTRLTLAFGLLDGRAFLTLDGALAAQTPWPSPAHTASERNTVRVLAVGDAGAVGARVQRVRLFHDVFYASENRPEVGIKEYRVEPDEVFLLGDNTYDSSDSRLHGAYPAADIIGRPVAIIGPWRRLAWLPR
jgi:signal peptidase I